MYDGGGTAAEEFGSDEELAAYYLSRTMENSAGGGERFYLLVFESGKVAVIADGLDRELKNAAKVSVIHSIFWNNAYRPSSGPQPFYTYVCNNPGMMDGIVLLTEAARRDFTGAYGHHERTFVIPHPYPYEIEPVGFEQRDPGKAIAVSRLFPEKQLDMTIDIFAMVVKALPHMKLEIYGIGPEQKQIEEYIKKLGMGDNIFLMGYTDDAISIYRGAVLSIMTSIAEGFGLTIMESICNGCPAFALDMKYGPSDIIRQGETGFLFALRDKAGFAKQIIKYLKDPDMQRAMSENCYADAPRFSRDVFLENWVGMAETLYRRKTGRNPD